MSYLPTLADSSELIPFPSSILSHLRSGSKNNVFYRSYISSFLTILYRGPNLEIVGTVSKERLAAWTFGHRNSSSNTETVEITCVAELDSSNVILGLDTKDGEGMICVFDVKICRIVKAVLLPYCVTSVVIISSLGGPNSNLRTCAEELMFFYGILAVGTQEGHLYLLDLLLDDDSSVSDEFHPSLPYFLQPQQNIQISELRSRLSSSGHSRHLCLTLNELLSCSQVLSHKDSMTSYVSCLSYVPQLGSLLVGFNFGCWQLWNLNSLRMEYGSPYDDNSSLSIIDFVFQEPENDPRNYCYIWTHQSENEYDYSKNKHTGTFSSIHLFALNHENRDEGDQYGVYYSGFLSCSKRFEYELTDHESEAIGSIGYSSKNLGSHSSFRSLELSESTTGLVNTHGLCIFLWETQLRGNRRRVYVGIFDLNMWYEARMPSYVQSYETDTQVSYLSYCKVQDISLDSHALNIHVHPGSLSRCKLPSNVEKQFYPSALSFTMTILLDQGFLTIAHVGLQRKVLLELQSQGPSALVDPKTLYRLCLVSGLISDSEVPDEKEQRSALLTVALENHLINLLTVCADYWSDGKYASVNCTLRFLLDWSWNRVAVIKKMVDKATLPLFDLSSTIVDDQMKKSLSHKCQQLRHLSSFLSTLYHHSETLGNVEIKIRKNVTQMVHLYLQVIIWFFSADLLPEVPLSSHDSPFPLSLIKAFYKDRRKELDLFIRQNNFLKVNSSLLLIDVLCSSFGETLKDVFKRDGGDGQYPPPNFRSAITLYLIDEVEEESLKHSLIHYLFLDLAHRLIDNEDRWSELLDRLVKFPSAFSVSPSLIKLTQAFWLLDQGIFDEALTQLLDPLIKDSDISGPQHRCILLAFLIQNQAKYALKYSRIRQPPITDVTDVQLQIDILLSNGNVLEAFTYQRAKRNMKKDLLLYFFSQAEKCKTLNSLLNMNLSKEEENEFVSFLQASKVRESTEILLMYYLQRFRYDDAMNFNLQVKSKAGASILERYAFLLPNLKGNAMKNVLKITSSKIPIPLSLEIKSSNFNPLLHTSLIEESLCGKDESVYTPFRPKNIRLKRCFSERDESLLCKATSSKIPRVQTINNTLQNEAKAILSTPILDKRIKKIQENSSISRHSSIMKSKLTNLEDQEENDDYDWLIKVNSKKSLRFQEPKILSNDESSNSSDPTESFSKESLIEDSLLLSKTSEEVKYDTRKESESSKKKKTKSLDKNNEPQSPKNQKTKSLKDDDVTESPKNQKTKSLKDDDVTESPKKKKSKPLKNDNIIESPMKKKSEDTFIKNMAEKDYYQSLSPQELCLNNPKIINTPILSDYVVPPSEESFIRKMAEDDYLTCVTPPVCNSVSTVLPTPKIFDLFSSSTKKYSSKTAEEDLIKETAEKDYLASLTPINTSSISSTLKSPLFSGSDKHSKESFIQRMAEQDHFDCLTSCESKEQAFNFSLPSVIEMNEKIIHFSFSNPNLSKLEVTNEYENEEVIEDDTNFIFTPPLKTPLVHNSDEEELDVFNFSQPEEGLLVVKENIRETEDTPILRRSSRTSRKVEFLGSSQSKRNSKSSRKEQSEYIRDTSTPSTFSSSQMMKEDFKEKELSQSSLKTDDEIQGLVEVNLLSKTLESKSNYKNIEAVSKRVSRSSRNVDAQLSEKVNETCVVEEDKSQKTIFKKVSRSSRKTEKMEKSLSLVQVENDTEIINDMIFKKISSPCIDSNFEAGNNLDELQNSKTIVKKVSRSSRKAEYSSISDKKSTKSVELETTESIIIMENEKLNESIISKGSQKTKNEKLFLDETISKKISRSSRKAKSDEVLNERSQSQDKESLSVSRVSRSSRKAKSDEVPDEKSQSQDKESLSVSRVSRSSRKVKSDELSEEKSQDKESLPVSRVSRSSRKTKSDDLSHEKLKSNNKESLSMSQVSRSSRKVQSNEVPPEKLQSQDKESLSVSRVSRSSRKVKSEEVLDEKSQSQDKESLSVSRVSRSSRTVVYNSILDKKPTTSSDKEKNKEKLNDSISDRVSRSSQKTDDQTTKATDSEENLKRLSRSSRKAEQNLSSNQFQKNEEGFEINESLCLRSPTKENQRVSRSSKQKSEKTKLGEISKRSSRFSRTVPVKISTDTFNESNTEENTLFQAENESKSTQKMEDSVTKKSSTIELNELDSEDPQVNTSTTIRTAQIEESLVVDSHEEFDAKFRQLKEQEKPISIDSKRFKMTESSSSSIKITEDVSRSELVKSREKLISARKPLQRDEEIRSDVLYYDYEPYSPFVCTNKAPILPKERKRYMCSSRKNDAAKKIFF